MRNHKRNKEVLDAVMKGKTSIYEAAFNFSISPQRVSQIVRRELNLGRGESIGKARNATS
jgi:hypothetical protein